MPPPWALPPPGAAPPRTAPAQPPIARSVAWAAGRGSTSTARHHPRRLARSQRSPAPLDHAAPQFHRADRPLTVLPGRVEAAHDAHRAGRAEVGLPHRTTPRWAMPSTKITGTSTSRRANSWARASHSAAANNACISRSNASRSLTADAPSLFLRNSCSCAIAAEGVGSEIAACEAGSGHPPGGNVGQTDPTCVGSAPLLPGSPPTLCHRRRPRPPPTPRAAQDDPAGADARATRRRR